jgi:hypothetical protein
MLFSFPSGSGEAGIEIALGESAIRFFIEDSFNAFRPPG